MTQEDIIRMATAAGIAQEVAEVNIDIMEAFAQLVRDDYSNKHAQLWLDRCHAFMLAEREACARACEAHGSTLKSAVWVAEECAAVIRARGQQ